MSTRSWDIFSGWSIPEHTTPELPDWSVFSIWFSSYDRLVEEQYVELSSLLQQWDIQLSEFGRDPTHRNWHTFRPLRLSREEDWSDWLAHLLQCSEGGVFARSLLAIPDWLPSDYSSPIKVEREVSNRGYRADIIITWRDQRYSHIEVKIGDESLAKTYETGIALRERYGVPRENWTNHILLLSRQLPSWEELDASTVSDEKVTAITWEDVSVALRKTLLDDREGIVWKVWAYTFLGAIEQLLIGFAGDRLRRKPIENLDTKVTILRKGLAHE